MQTQQQTILVTGATAGFGKAIAKLLVSQGHTVIGVGRRQAKLDELTSDLETESGQFIGMACDISDTSNIQPMLDKLNSEHGDSLPIDVLVNNAGLALGTEPAFETKLDDWMTMVDTNIKGLIALTHAILPDMVERNSGYIINVGSIAGNYPYFGGNVYGATKAFVRQFSLNLRADLLGKNVRVTNLEPGNVGGTEFSVVRYHGDTGKANKVYEGFESMSAVDIADIVSWLIHSPAHVNVNTLEVMPTAQTFAGLRIAKNGDKDV